MPTQKGKRCSIPSVGDELERLKANQGLLRLVSSSLLLCAHQKKRRLYRHYRYIYYLRH